MYAECTQEIRYRLIVDEKIPLNGDTLKRMKTSEKEKKRYKLKVDDSFDSQPSGGARGTDNQCLSFFGNRDATE